MRRFLLIAVLAAGPALAQPRPNTQVPQAPLPAGPLYVAPENAQWHVTLVQVDAAGAKLGDPVAVDCPTSGCQQPLTLRVGKVEIPTMASVQFVERGAYLTLQPQSLAAARIMDFDQGRPAPIFLLLRDRSRSTQTVRLIVGQDASLRRLQQGENPDSYAAGAVFNRKLTPDAVLKVTFEAVGKPAG